MESNNKTEILKDLQNKKLTVVREFNAPLDSVWRAWTESDLLDQWWMPKPWKAKTKTLTFEVSGKWHYASIGPDGTTMWCLVEFKSIKPNSSFEAISSFCDENGNKNSDFPSSTWNNNFIATETGTKVTVEISLTSDADFKKLIEMGFETGFTMALGNLDGLLANKKIMYN